MAFNAGRVEVHLGAQLERRDFDLYERELKKVRTQVAKKEQFKAQLGGDFNPRAFNAYQRELKKTERSMDENVRAQGRLRTSFGAVYGKGGALFAAAGGIAAVTIGLKSVVKASGEAEVSQRKMAAQLKASGISYAAHAKEIDKVIQATSKLSGLDDEDLQDSFTNIVRATGSVKQGLDGVRIAADLARAKHMDVATAGQLVAKVFSGNVGALKRLGIAFDPVTTASDKLSQSMKDQIRALQKQATTAKGPAREAILQQIQQLQDSTRERAREAKQTDKQTTGEHALAELRKRVSGQAAAYGKTQQGAFDRVRVAFENLQETIGTRLGPTITRTTNRLAKFIDEMGVGKGTGGDFVNTLKAVAHNFKVFGDRCREDIDLLLSFLTTAINGAGAVARLTSKLIPGRDMFEKFAEQADRSADRINKLRKQIRPSGHEFDDLTSSVGHMNDHLGDGRGFRRFSGNLKSIRSAAHTQVTGAVSDVQQGLNQIRAALSANLKDLGVSGTLKPIGGLKLHGAATPLGKAGGGWIGQRGMIGQDVVPAMLAPGEAVLNRHQQTIIETLLGQGFLDQLFARVSRPHYLAGGGRAGLMGANPGLAPYAALGSRYGLSVTSGRRPGSITSSGNVSLHSSGDAIDVNAGRPGSMLSYAKAMASRFGSGLDELIHSPLGFGIKNGRRVAPYAVADHYDHVHVGDRTPGAAGGGFADKISAPRVGGSGALQAIVQGSLNLSAQGATRQLQNAVGSMGIPSDFGTGGGKLTGGQFGKSQLASLWRRAGGDRGRANLMAAIALAESGGNPRAHNPSGASGLWQILGLPFPGDPFNPATNARMAVAKYQSQGLGAWEAYTNGSYRQYLARGGRASKRKKIHKPSAAHFARQHIQGLASLQTDRVPLYDSYISNVDDLNTGYGLREREYDLSVEELVNDDGSINERAVKKRGDELAGLASFRQRIIEQLIAARELARRIIKTYNTIIVRLRKSLAHAKGKSRASIRETISTYGERRDEWTGKLHELETSTLPSARLDLRELLAERREVLGTKAEASADTGGEDASGDTGGDTGGSDTGSPDTTTAPPSAADIAAGAAQEFATYLSGAQDLFRNFGGNFARGGGGILAPDVATAIAGVHGFGATGGGGGLGGVNGAPVIVVQQGGSFAQFASAPDDGPTFMSQVRFQVESAAG